jgi:putative membrane-bound dehydrogenase-like protein
MIYCKIHDNCIVMSRNRAVRRDAFRFLLVFLWSLLGLRSAQAHDAVPAPLSPAAEKATFRLADRSLEIELVAAEPQVTSPVALAWDADGFLFVAEMNDYPVAPTAGRIKRLEDRDGDGVYERATVFADGLPFLNGVLPCFGGVLVTAAPNIWFLRDVDGDGRAEERRVVLTGFGEGNSQLRVNGLYWGLDNWIYAANGRSDGEIRTPDMPPRKAVSIRRRDVRFQFRPYRKEVLIEAIAGFSQFGLAHDDWGNRFPSWNEIPLRHVVLEQAALDRNPFLAETSSIASILDLADGGRVYSISPVQARFNRESVNYFNASCGPTVYRGDRLGQGYAGNAFVCEPLTNLVHRRVLEPRGCSFLARRVEVGEEFLSSTDSSFRPVNLSTGPDGALYVVDMYRELVEHPDYVPPDLRSQADFRRWHDRGRIWRVRARRSSVGAPAEDRRPALGQSSLEQLVRQLGHPVGWRRDTAQRLLVERQDRRAAPLLEEIVRNAVNPLARLHALWTLDGLQAIGASTLERAARDAHPGLREHALRVAGASTSESSSLPAAVVADLAADLDVRVRLQAALVLGNAGSDQRAIRSLAGLASRDSKDPWVRLAILSGLGETSIAFLEERMRERRDLLESPIAEDVCLLTEVASIVGVRRRDAEMLTLVRLLDPARQGDQPASSSSVSGLIGCLALVSGLGRGMERSGAPLYLWLSQSTALEREQAKRIASLWPAARALALSDQAAPRRRLALEALVRGQPETAASIIPALLRPDQALEVQSEAVRALGMLGRSDLAMRVLESWSELSPGSRRELLPVLIGSSALVGPLIAAIEHQDVSASELDPASRDTLLHLPDASLRKRCQAILARTSSADRSKVIAQYQAALTLGGDARRGAVLFEKNCQTCHHHQGRGHRVGPDLSGIAGRPSSVLLSDILDPNRDVAPDFVVLSVATRQGLVFSGLLVEETASTLKLRKAEGLEESILRSEIAELRSSGRSLMPEGIEQTVNPAEMSDLLAFLRSDRQTGK